MFFLPLLLGASSGLQIAGQFGAAKRREQTADLNYQIDQQNAADQRFSDIMTIRFGAMRDRAALSQARSNYRLSLLESDARERNAQRLRLFAEARTKQGREALKRTRREFDAFEGTQRATIAASGVSFEGSAIDVLAETAGQMQIALQDMHDQTNYERAEIVEQANMEQLGANLGRMAATNSFEAARRAARMNRGARRVARSSAGSRYSSSLFGATLRNVEQYDYAAGQRLGAVGGIFAGAANVYGGVSGGASPSPVPSAYAAPTGTGGLSRSIFRQTYSANL